MAGSACSARRSAATWSAAAPSWRTGRNTGSRETLRLTNVEIAGDVLLNLGFTSLGYVSLWGTKIGRDLDCSTATFIGPSPVAAGRSTGRGARGDQPGGCRRREADRRHGAGAARLRAPADRRQPDLGRAAVSARGRPSAMRATLSHRASMRCRGCCCRMRGSARRSWRATSPPRWRWRSILAVPGPARWTMTGFPAGWGVGRIARGTVLRAQPRRLRLRPVRPSAVGRGQRPRRRAVGHRALGGASRPRPFGVLGDAPGAPDAACAAGACEAAAGLGAAPAEQRPASSTRSPTGILPRSCARRATTQAAREVAIVEQWATPSANRVTRMLRSVWGVCFGFGLSPMRATATVAVLLAIGTARCVVGLEAGRRAGRSTTPTR